MAPVPLTFGCASVNSDGRFNTPAAVQDLFSGLLEVGITRLDSAQLYGDCEDLLGKSNVSARGFVIDGKHPGGWVPGSLVPDNITASLHSTLKCLGVDKLDTYFIHGPDRDLPLGPALQALDSLHRQGLFSRLGLSNFSAQEVVAAHELATANGWLAPSVYQGNYSAFARRQEAEMLPALRRLGISFCAYSPLAGGFLARRGADELAGTATGGRFAVDPEDPEGKKGGLGLYRELYSSRPKLVDALAEWGRIADDAGCSCPAELGYRWVAWHSALDGGLGDSITVGASSVDQLRKTVEWVSKGKLSDETRGRIDALWREIQNEAPLDNLHK